MKRITLVLLLSLIFALLQTAFFPVLFDVYVNPNLILALAVAFLLAGETELAYISALFGGLIIDIVSTHQLGLSPMYFCLAVFLLSLISRMLWKGPMPILLFSLPIIYIYKFIVGNILIFSMPLLFGMLITCLIEFILYIFYKHFKYDQPII